MPPHMLRELSLQHRAVRWLVPPQQLQQQHLLQRLLLPADDVVLPTSSVRRLLMRPVTVHQQLAAPL